MPFRLAVDRSDTSDLEPELRETIGKGLGVFAKRGYAPGQTVIVGVIERTLGGNDSHATQVGVDRFIRHKGLNCLVNHSCDPNCGISENHMGWHDIIAIKDIRADQEITIDYAMRNYTIEHFPNQCTCGSVDCRGKITGWKDLPWKTKARYLKCSASYLWKIEEQRRG